MRNNILIFGTKNFNNSLNEIKEYLNFSLVFFDKSTFSELSISTIHLVLVDRDICHDTDTLFLINQIKNKPLLLIDKPKHPSRVNFVYTETINLPLKVLDITSKITNLITAKKFKQNSSVQIKEYELDKNERKLKKKNLSITITEREIQLIELLFDENKPLSKNIILKKVWMYADDADTHTIETHIYRLRKKILRKFKDENFIINSKDGYSI